MQSVSKHQWALFVLGSSQALWKLALDHSSKWKQHHGPTEKLSTIYSSPLAQDPSLLSFEWFRNTYSSLAQSLEGWGVPPFLPLSGWNKRPCSCFLSILHPNLGFNHMEHFDICLEKLPFCLCAHLFLNCYLKFWYVNCCAFYIDKADWWIYPICWLVCFWANYNLKNWVRKGHLALKMILLGIGVGFEVANRISVRIL